MTTTITANKTVRINAPVDKVWQALTDPLKIRQYIFGTEMTTDWKKGSDITYKGVWDGELYEDKGKIIDIVPGRRLHTTYLSGASGKEDNPDNYNNLIYELRSEGRRTYITVTQDKIKDETELEEVLLNWSMILYGMKKLAEHL